MSHSITYSALHLKCPQCREGNLFTKRGLFVYRDMLSMNEICPVCALKFEIEPGFWLGALWASYPIVALIEIPFLFAAVFSERNMVWIYFLCMVLAFLLAWPLMLRLGRSIWIHFWVKFKPNSQH